MCYSYRSRDITIDALFRCDGTNKAVYMKCEDEAKTLLILKRSLKGDLLVEKVDRWLKKILRFVSFSLYLIKTEYVKLRISFSSPLEF